MTDVWRMHDMLDLQDYIDAEAYELAKDGG
jgi:hypothetical protein